MVKKSDKDQVLIVASGVTLHEALKASEKLEMENIAIRILDPFTIKPIDKELILLNAHECGLKIITVEDHYPEGNLLSMFTYYTVCECILFNLIFTRYFFYLKI